MKIKFLLLASLLLFVAESSFAKITLPHVFGDDMVLQRNDSVLLWGWGDLGEEIEIVTGWGNKTYTAKTAISAKWSIRVKTPDAGGPFTLVFKGEDNEISLSNILIGEVWLCSGQSNMEWSATTNAGIDNGEEEIRNADHPKIRLFSVEKRSSEFPQEDVPGSWAVCNPESMKEFSAIAYFFARRLQGELNVPIGLIDNAWGGSPAEVWATASVFEQHPELAKEAEALEETPWSPVAPSALYNALVHPLIPFKIAGTIWYQGESNVSRHESYTKLFSEMVASWREAWGYDFPFYYVQIAPYQYGDPELGAYLRDAQRKALKVIPKSGMVVTSDIATIDDIHPPNKQDVGLRLANLALKEHYETFDGEVNGPLFKETRKDGKQITVIFDHAEGLTFEGKGDNFFEIAGEDGEFHPAKAKIQENTVVLRSKAVPDPVKVRFAWSNIAEPNLVNGAGLPTSAFLSDTD